MASTRLAIRFGGWPTMTSIICYPNTARALQSCLCCMGREIPNLRQIRLPSYHGFIMSSAAEPIERIPCQWCQSMNEKAALTCRSCGAPLDIRNLVSESGWREAPRIKDMTQFQFSSSSCQVEGEIVPVAEINLSQGDSVFFE